MMLTHVYVFHMYQTSKQHGSLRVCGVYALAMICSFSTDQEEGERRPISILDCVAVLSLFALWVVSPLPRVCKQVWLAS